jgi:hypothetical protein
MYINILLLIKNMKSVVVVLLLFFSFFSKKNSAQCNPAAINCDPAISKIVMSSPTNLDLTFDSFSEYNGGITLNGSTIIRLKVFDNPAQVCKWKLSMIVQNGVAPVPSEWERLAMYGSGSGVNPQLDILQVKVTNGCANTIGNGTWRTFLPLTGSSLDLINSAVATPAGTCNPLLQTNGSGSFLTNYNEYSFTIDYRLVPGFTYVPGRYELNIKFCLTEL